MPSETFIIVLSVDRVLFIGVSLGKKKENQIFHSENDRNLKINQNL